MTKTPGGLMSAFFISARDRWQSLLTEGFGGAGDASRISASKASASRKSAALPGIFSSGRNPLPMPKPTAANLRRFAETPVARRAINCIKDRIACMRWRVQPKSGLLPDQWLEGGEAEFAASAGHEAVSNPAALAATQAERIRILTANLDAPNSDDSFRSLCEQVLEDVIVGGFGALELQLTGNAQQPLALYPVDGASIRLRGDWDGGPSSIRYVQATGRPGADSSIALRDEELSYIRLNPRTHTPFGLGRLEVAFETISAFLGAHRYAGRLASNSVVQYALWLQELDPAQHDRLIRWWQDDVEGTGRVPILTLENKPEVLRFGGGTDQDLRLAWQEFLMRIIADAFDLPPFFLGLEGDVNRSTAEEASQQAFRSAIVPTARLLAEHFTRDIIHKRLGWNDLEFVFADLDARSEREQAEIDEILLRSGVLTVNEVRAARGLPPTIALPAAPAQQ